MPKDWVKLLNDVVPILAERKATQLAADTKELAEILAQLKSRPKKPKLARGKRKR